MTKKKNELALKQKDVPKMLKKVNDKIAELQNTDDIQRHSKY